MAPITQDTLLLYCQRVYDALAEEATTGENGALIWEGRIVEAFGKLRISNAHYSRVMGTLQEVGAIEQLQKGARGVPSVYALHFRPEVEVPTGESPLTKPTNFDKLASRVTGLERRLDGIDLKVLLANLESRVKRLESQKK